MLLAASLNVMDAWRPAQTWADGALPALGCYGVPASWPHVRDAYLRAGFVFDGHVEIILVAQVDDLPRPGEAPLPGLTVRREVGQFGTQFAALLGGERIGFIDGQTSWDSSAPPASASSRGRSGVG